MAQSSALTLPQRLLAKYIIRRARSVSAAVVTADTERQFDRHSYIIKMLEATPGLRDTVKAMATASNSSGQKQLLAILTMFDAIDPNLQGAFIVAFKGCATLATQGAREVVRAQSWDQDHIPPHQEP